MHSPGPIIERTLDGFTSKLLQVEGFVLPERRIQAVGELVFDSEMLAVHIINIYQGMPGANQPGYPSETRGVSVMSMDYGVTIVRKQPSMGNYVQAPPDSELVKSAQNAAEDAHQLVTAFYALAAENVIAGPCDIIWNGGVSFNGPQGEMLGTQLTLSIQL